MQPLIYIGEVCGNIFRALTKSDFPGCCEFLASLNEDTRATSRESVKSHIETMISTFSRKVVDTDGDNPV